MKIPRKRDIVYFFLISFIILGLINPINFVSADGPVKQTYENDYGKLEVWPITDTNPINHKQYWELTSNYTGCIDIAFAFDIQLLGGGVYRWNGDEYIQMEHTHIEYNNRHYYVLSNLNVVSGNNYSGYWTYKTLFNTSGKWDMYVKRCVDTWADYRIHLDPWWNTEWEYRKKITIDHTQVEATLTNFPVLIKTVDADLRDNAQSDGDDITFINYDNTTQYNHEIEYYNNATGNLTAWVNITSLSGTSDTSFWMYYGNTSCSSQENVADTWDTDVYRAVFHMNDASGGIADSTTNGETGTEVGDPTYQQTNGVGYSIYLDGNDYFKLSDQFEPTFRDSFAVMTYFKMDDGVDGTSQTLMGGGNNPAEDRINIQCQANTGKLHSIYESDNNQGRALTNDAVFINGVNPYVFTYSVFDDADDQVYIYIDGANVALDGTDDGDLSGVTFANYNNGVGDEPDVGSYNDEGSHSLPLTGYIDELRIINTDASGDWVITCYNTITNSTSGGFYTIASQETENYAPEISNPSPANNSVDQARPPTLSIDVSDVNGDTFNITWYSNSSGSWVSFATNNSVTNGTFTQTNSNFSTSNTTFYWNISADDGNQSNESDIFNFKTLEGVSSVTGFTATYNTTTDYMELAWTKGTNSTHTRIQRSTSTYPTTVSGGTNVYNGTSSSRIDSTVAAGYTYYYSVWAYNSTLNEFSSSYVTASNSTRPQQPQNVSGLQYNSTIVNFSWDTARRADNYTIRVKSGSYPSSITDGTELCNTSNLYFNDTGYVTNDYYAIWSWNSTSNLYSLLYQIEWGGLVVYVYNESNGNAITSWGIFVTNQSGSETYEDTTNNNGASFSITSLPSGENIAVIINATGYDSRTYYMNLNANEQYTLYAYLLHEDTGSWYEITVINELDETVSSANIVFKKNVGGSYVNISDMFTDAAGKVNMNLEARTLYKVHIEKTGYDDTDADWVPPTINYYTDAYKTFQLNFGRETNNFSSVSDFIHFNATISTTGTIKVWYTDHNSSTINTTIYIYEVYNGTSVLNHTDTRTGDNSFSFTNATYNTSRVHKIVLYFNHTYLDFHILTYWLFPITSVPDETEIEDIWTDVFGDFDLGWVKTFLVFLPCMFFLLIFAPEHNGLGILTSGLYLTFTTSYIKISAITNINGTDPLIVVGTTLAVIGVVYILAKQGGKRI